jgi:hypothetical protein
MKLRSHIEEKIRIWDSEASNYLRTKKVNWLEERTQPQVNSVQIVDVHVKTPPMIFPGNEIFVSFGIKNISKQGIARASVFLRSVHREMETREELLGYIQAGEKKEDQISFEIPGSWLDGRVDFQLGVAINSIEQSSSLYEFSLDLSERVEPVLKLSFHAQRVLKSGETSDLLVNIKNESDVDVHIDKIKIVNLSGKQFSVQEEGNLSWHEIPAHQQKSFSVKVGGSKVIYSDHIDLGFTIESPELKSPLYKIITMRALPTATLEKLSEFGR